jgi:hypothetical protein
MDEQEKRRNEILDEIIQLRKEYFASSKIEGVLVRKANEVMKYAQTQNIAPEIPTRYLKDLTANISISQKIESLVGLIEKTYDITKQEREFLYSITK